MSSDTSQPWRAADNPPPAGESPDDDAHRPAESGAAPAEAPAEAPGDSQTLGVPIPDELAILPLRGVVVYPLTAAPLAVGQPRSIRLIDDAVLNQRLIGLVASKDASIEEPGADDV